MVWYDAAHLGKFERGERVPPREVAKRCDEKLDADGALLRLWELVQKEKLAPDEAKTGADEGKIPELVASSPGDTRWSGEGADGLSVPAISPEGKTIIVHISRRDALRAIGGTAFAAAVSLMPHPELRSRVVFAQGKNAVDRALVECARDTLATYRKAEDVVGGLKLWPIVQSQLDTITQFMPAAAGDIADELLCLSAEHAHWLSWVAHREGQLGPALSWLDLASGWAADGGSADLVSWISRVKATYALSRKDGVRAARLADAACQGRLSPAAAAAALHTAAMAAAATGDKNQARLFGDRARSLALTVPNKGERPRWLYWLDPVRADLQRADVAYAVGDWSDAAFLYSSKIEMLHDYPQDYLYYSGRFRDAQAKV